MKKWHIEYWQEQGKSPIEKWLNKLPDEMVENVLKELRILEILGNKLSLPHSRSLGKGLFELRERRFGLRVYYTYRDGTIIVLLAAGDKSSQDRDIKMARKRLSILMR